MWQTRVRELCVLEPEPFQVGEASQVAEILIRDSSALQLKERDIRESSGLLIAQSPHSEIMQPHGRCRLRMDPWCPNLVEIRHPCLLPMHPPSNPEAERSHEHDQRHDEQDAR